MRQPVPTNARRLNNGKDIMAKQSWHDKALADYEAQRHVLDLVIAKLQEQKADKPRKPRAVKLVKEQVG